VLSFLSGYYYYYVVFGCVCSHNHQILEVFRGSRRAFACGLNIGSGGGKMLIAYRWIITNHAHASVFSPSQRIGHAQRNYVRAGGTGTVFMW
jgi:hypothetical protein